MTWWEAAGSPLYLGVLHVEAVLVVLRDVALYAGHVPTLAQPGEVGPECLATNIASNLPVDTISEAVVLGHLAGALGSVQLHVLYHLGVGPISQTTLDHST